MDDLQARAIRLIDPLIPSDAPNRVEDLAVVTLAHELALGYTHQGRDIDGLSWADDGFARTAPEVKEGLEQCDTAVVAEELGSPAPAIRAAYVKLLDLQTGPYLVHTRWRDGTRKQRGATIRFVLLQARNYGVVAHLALASELQ